MLIGSSCAMDGGPIACHVNLGEMIAQIGEQKTGPRGVSRLDEDQMVSGVQID